MPRGSFLKKRASEWTLADLSRLVDEEFQEGAELEFKGSLPAKGGKDTWLEGANELGDRARNEIIAEVIAFANAYGGTFVVGIEETEEQPARAGKIVPIPRCADLAERLKLVCRDCIEPQIPLIEIEAVKLESSGSGAIVIRVPKSRMAPHRHTVTKECYVRRADRSEKMSMREIQDLTLQISRGMTLVEETFKSHRDRFRSLCDGFKIRYQKAWGMRATLVPLTPIFIDRVHNVDGVRPPILELRAKIDDGETLILNVPFPSAVWCPVLRGTRCINSYGDYDFRIEATCNCVIEYSSLSGFDDGDPPRIYAGWLMGLVGNAICAAERIRYAAGASEVEFGLELNIWSTINNIFVAGYSNQIFIPRSLGEYPMGHTIFPHYSVGTVGDFQRLTNQIETDFWHAAGRDWNHDISIDFKSVLGSHPALE